MRYMEYHVGDVDLLYPDMPCYGMTCRLEGGVLKVSIEDDSRLLRIKVVKDEKTGEETISWNPAPAIAVRNMLPWLIRPTVRA